jgi:PBP1b-binding outer membrane lipoprotein LpoB
MEVARRALLLIAVLAAGCGSSAPAHEVRPLAERPPVPTDVQNLKTPEDKIRYIENSNAPESEKEKAIAQIRAGKL